MKPTLRIGLWIFFFLSGATGLLYEIVWMRQLILVFGSTTHAVAAVISAFMLGLALGSYGFGRLADRGHNLVRYYALLELGVGLYALVAPFLLLEVAPFFVRVWGPDSAPGPFSAATRFLGALLVLVPPTILMGGTLPVLARLLSTPGTEHAGPVGRLYAVNTAGAVAGTMLTGFLLLPSLGVRRTTLVAAAVNLILGLLAVIFSSAQWFRPGASSSLGTASAPAPPASLPFAREQESRASILLVFASTGFAAMLCEVGWTRVLALTIGSSVYGFTLMLAAFLVGLAGGAALFAGVASRPGTNASRTLALLLVGVGAASLTTSLLLRELPYAFSRVFEWSAGSSSALFIGQLGLCLLLMFPSTFLMGGIFPLVLRFYAGSETEVGQNVGEAYAANTIGTVVGSAAAGFVILPLVGVRNTLLAAVAMDLILAAVILAPSIKSRAARLLVPAGSILASGLVFALAPAWDAQMMNTGIYLSADKLKPGFSRAEFQEMAVGRDRVLYYREGMNASVLVAQEASGEQIYLKVNGKTDATSDSDLDTQILLGQIPFLFHSNPKSAMVIGLASGITVASVATHPVDKIRVVEVEPSMVGAAHEFARYNRKILDDPRVHVVINDARNDLLLRQEKYDIIVSEPSNPWMTVAANLFTLDFFRTAKTRLNEGGVFAQWIQTYRLSPEDLRSLIGTYRAVFPHVLAFGTEARMSDLVVIGSDRPLALDYSGIRRSMSDLPVSMDYARSHVRSPEDILSLLFIAPPGLEEYVSGVSLNTDDNARIEFSAPLTLHEGYAEAIADQIYPHRARLLSLVTGLPEEPQARREILLSLAESLLENNRRAAARDVLLAAEQISSDERSKRLQVQAAAHSPTS